MLPFSKDSRYSFHILYGSGKQVLLLDLGNASHTAVSLSMQLFVFRKAALDRFISALINILRIF